MKLEGMTVLQPQTAVLIDGRSGSGKTMLATQLARQLGAPGSPAQTLHLDSLYPGWDGLAEGSRSVARALQLGQYRPYDWVAGEFSRSRIILDQNRPLIIEGCGALTIENLCAAHRWVSARETECGGPMRRASVRGESGREEAGLNNAGLNKAVRAIWMECDDGLRRSRALARDGKMFAPHWYQWAEQERQHYSVHTPWRLADEVVRSG